MNKKNQLLYIIIFMLIIYLPIIFIPVFTNNDENPKDYTNNSDSELQGFEKIIYDFESDFNFSLPLRSDIIGVWSNALYSLGVSVNPAATIVGKDDWLFLGDDYQNIFSAHRGTIPFNENSVNRSVECLSTLSRYFEDEGVDFLYLIAPDKASIYPEYLPAWYTSDENTISYIDQLKLVVNSSELSSATLFLDDILLNAKSGFGDHLYGKSDTHWTTLGAYIGYYAAVDKLNKISGFVFEVITMYDYTVAPFPGCDLRWILGLTKTIDDHATNLLLSQTHLIEPRNISLGLNYTLEVYKNDKALNDKKVLFIRDSFGVSMLPYLYTTFNEVIVVGSGNILSPDQIDMFYQIYNQYSPDIVVFENAERYVETVLNYVSSEIDNPVDYFDSEKIIAQDSGDMGLDNREIILSDFTKESDSITLELNITAPELSSLAVSFSDSENGDFSDETTVVRTCFEGENLIYIKLDSDSPISSVKLVFSDEFFSGGSYTTRISPSK